MPQPLLIRGLSPSSAGCRDACSSVRARRGVRLRNTDGDGCEDASATRGSRRRVRLPSGPHRHPARRRQDRDGPAPATAARRAHLEVRGRAVGRSASDRRPPGADRLGRRRPGAAALHRPPAPALAPRTPARTRREHQRAGARTGHRVRQPAGVRPRRRCAIDRLARDRRSSTTMLRTWRPERDRHVVIVIDTGRTAAARVGDGVRMDAAMEAALLLAAARDPRRRPHPSAHVRPRRPARVTRVDGLALPPALVDAMAPVEPQLIDTDWDAAFAQVRALTSRPSLVVLLTARTPWRRRAGSSARCRLTRRAHVLVGTVTEERRRTRPTGRRGCLRAPPPSARRRTPQSSRRRWAGPARGHRGRPRRSPRGTDRCLALKAAGRPEGATGSSTVPIPSSTVPWESPVCAPGYVPGAPPVPIRSRRRARYDDPRPEKPIQTDASTPPPPPRRPPRPSSQRPSARPARARRHRHGAVRRRLRRRNSRRRGVGFLGVSLAVGLTVVAGAYAFGPISGGHFDPTGTPGSPAGRFPWRKSIGYIIAQIIGGASRRRSSSSSTSSKADWLDGPRTATSRPTAGTRCRPAASASAAPSSSRSSSRRALVIVILGVTNPTRGTPRSPDSSSA